MVRWWSTLGALLTVTLTVAFPLSSAPGQPPKRGGVVPGTGALEGPPPLLPRLRLLALPLDRRLLVVRAPLHLLKEAGAWRP